METNGLIECSAGPTDYECFCAGAQRPLDCYGAGNEEAEDIVIIVNSSSVLRGRVPQQ